MLGAVEAGEEREKPRGCRRDVGSRESGASVIAVVQVAGLTNTGQPQTALSAAPSAAIQ